MAGLLDSLNSLFSGSGISADISVQVEGLNTVKTAVQALTQGPQALADIEGSIGSLPVPPGLDGIGNLASNLGDLQVPTDFSGALAPILAPITGLSFQATANVGATIAAFELIREIVGFFTGQAPGGPSGMPDERPPFRLQDTPSPEELRGVFTEANQLLDGLGGPFDAPRILQLLQQASSGFGKPNYMLPVIPVLGDLMEALGTLSAWQGMTGDQLTAHLARTLNLVAQLIATPRNMVAAPIIQAGDQIRTARASLGERTGQLGPVFSSLRAKATITGVQPTTNEVVAVEETADYLHRLAATMDPSASLMAQWSLADENLTRQLLAVIRALEPSYSLSGVSAALQAKIALIPTPPDSVVDELVAEVEAFDLSALTDPLQAITNAARSAVDEVNAAQESVRQALESALSPVANALDAALAAAGFQQIRDALDGLPGQIQSFVDTQITPNLEGVRTAVSNAVSAVSEAADEFNPEALIAPLRDAVENAAELLKTGEVRQVFADLERVLNEAISAIESIDLAIAADASIDLIGGIEEKVAAIDPSSIPDAAKPLLSQAVQVVTNIDFSVEVGTPVLAKIEQAAQQGPAAALGALEGAMDSLRASLESFKPSVAIGDLLDKPFKDLIAVLTEFKPSDLLNRLQEALDQLAGRLRVLDVGAVVNPLIDLHAAIAGKIDAVKPSTLLKPVNDAIAAAIEKVYQATGIDTVFAGINDVLGAIQAWTGLLADGRDFLNRAAELFAQPGDATAAVNQIVEDAAAKLDSVDMTRLQTAFQSTSAAAASIERDVIARDVANAFGAAGANGVSLLDSSELAAIARFASEFPLDQLQGRRSTPARDRLIVAIESWRSSATRLQSARAKWVTLGPELNDAAGRIQERLLDYYRVSRIEGDNLFAEFLNPPQTTAALKEAVRRALAEELIDPLTTVLLGFQAISPFVRLAGSSMGRLFGALHAKIDSIIGSGGVGGTIDAIEEAANLLRGINLNPISQPLDALHARLVTAVNAVNPEPLRAALEAARDAIANLLRITTLINQSDIDVLDATYATAVNKIGALSPSAVVSATLDPVFEDVLAEFLPVLDLPVQLRLRIEAAGRTLRDEAVQELARVEAAFDDMLRAIPLGDGAVSGSISVGVSVG